VKKNEWGKIDPAVPRGRIGKNTGGPGSKKRILEKTKEHYQARVITQWGVWGQIKKGSTKQQGE